MKRLFTLGMTMTLAVSLAAPALAGSNVETIEVRLVDTHVFGVPFGSEPFGPMSDPGSNWMTGDIWKMRHLPVTETMQDLDGSEAIGTVERSVNFNWDMAALAAGEVVSTAWCTFGMHFDDPELGSVKGACNGDLLSGELSAAGRLSVVSGTYALEPGGIPGVGPYVLALRVRSS